jgi:hypothetical protein
MMNIHILAHGVTYFTGLFVSFVVSHLSGHKKDKPISKAELALLLYKDAQVVSKVKDYCNHVVNDD